MAIKQLRALCWVVARPSGEGESHYESEDAAKARAGKAAVRLLTGCWVVACDECGDRPEDDDYGVNIHCASRAEAVQFIASAGWTVTRDGQVFCAEDEPDCSVADLAVIEQAPGQLVLGAEEMPDGS